MGCENSGADVLCSCPAPNFLSPPPLFNLQIAKLLCDRKSVQCGLQAHAYIHTACRRECMNAADTRLRFAAPDLRLYRKCKLYIPCRKVLHQTISACRTSGTYDLAQIATNIKIQPYIRFPRCEAATATSSYVNLSPIG